MAARSFQFSGVRAVAIFEAVKGILILTLGFGLLSLINHDVGSEAEWLVRHLHMDPANHYPHIFIEAASHVTDTHLWLLALLALVDSTVRCAAGYGLWFNKKWGTWLGVVTAGTFIPVEIYEIIHHVTVLKIVTLVINLVIVVYLGSLIYSGKQHPQNSTEPITPDHAASPETT